MCLTLVSTAFAANLSVRIEQPKTPTKTGFDISFVALDIQNRTIIAKCFKKAPGDPGFTQFGSDINLTAGGNTDICPVNSTILSTEGTYSFYAEATATGGETVPSSTVSVEYRNSTGPDTPGNYSKDKTSSCEYTIKFKTANDGKTSKVKIYRSDQTSFTADASTEVGTVNIGPNLESSFTNSVPDCGKTYYFAIRAFDDLGNGSGTAGDSITTTVITEGTTQTTTQTTQASLTGGAIPVSSSQVGQGDILGEQTATDGAVLGEEGSTPSASPAASSSASTGIFTKKNIFWAAILGVAVLLAYQTYKKLKKSSK